MNKNIVFFDIDGTLVSEENHIIPESTKEAIKKIRENGHLAFINTGRPVSEITNTHREIGFDGLICGCGTYIEYNNEVLLYKSLGKELSKELGQAMQEYNLDGVLEGRNGVYFDNLENIKHKEILRIIDIHKNEGFYKGTTWYEDNLDIDKLVIFLNEDSNFNGFYEKYKNIFDFIKRADDFYELVPSGYSKASGIKYIINHLNIPYENTYAIGDSTNDLSMLEYVNHSIAMGNSNPILFNLVSFITKNLEDDGIHHALSHYNML
ncbi:HAD family hydrolase [Clostridium paraputrificum]|uniref:HAD family hydrolase n=1 Tax=Clostridium TaxID=1485 RepID=UPI003D32D30E